MSQSSHRPGYRESLRWIIMNDDTECLGDEDPVPSVTMALVADQFRKPIETVMADLSRMADDLWGNDD